MLVVGGLGNLVAGLYFSCLGTRWILLGQANSCSDKIMLVGESGGVGSLGFLGFGVFIVLCSDNLLSFIVFGGLSGVC